MSPATPQSPQQTPASPRRWPAVAATGLVLVAALLAWGLVQLLAGLGPLAAPLGAALAVALVGLPVAAWGSAWLQRAPGQGPPTDAGEPVRGVTGRSEFLALAEREWARARRYGDSAALLVVDVDRFHALCEQRGAAAGDAVLRALAASTGPTLRGADAMARFGGAQIVVWLAQADPLGALDVAERIRERTETLDIDWQQATLRVTVSVGVAALRPTHPNLGALVEDAEAAVQAARQTGGNCVRAAPVDPLRLRIIGPSVGDNQAAGPV